MGMATVRGGATNGREVIERFWAAVEGGDMSQAAELVSDDVLMEWPQSGERFRGRANALAAVEAQTDKPEFAGEPRIVGAGDVWVVSVPLRYAQGISHYVGVFEVERGKIARTTEYFAAPFPAPEFRAKYTER